MTKHFASIMLFLTLGIVFQDCAQQQNIVTMTVELDVFSGVPNPKWEIPKELTPEVQKRLEDLPLQPRGQQMAEEHMGYRGFVLTSTDPASQKQTRFRVFRGTIHSDSGQSFQDEKGLEAWLIEQAKKQGFHDLFDGL